MKRIGMKVALAVMAGLLLSAVLPDTAEAKHSKRQVVRHCGGCHAPVYAEYRFVGYDHCGHPVYRWVEPGHQCSHQHHNYGSRDPVADAIAGILRGIVR